MDIYTTIQSDKIVLDIETDKNFNILQIAYNFYDINNNLLGSKDMYIYDGIHSLKMILLNMVYLQKKQVIWLQKILIIQIY